MEYQFIKDPIEGFRLRITDEHSNLGRWLTDEVGVNSQKVFNFIDTIKSHCCSFLHDYEQIGKELLFRIHNGEVSVSVIHAQVSELEAERITQEMLAIESHSDFSECGLDDFLHLVEDWALFLKDNRA